LGTPHQRIDNYRAELWAVAEISAWHIRRASSFDQRLASAVQAARQFFNQLRAERLATTFWNNPCFASE
jgi:hypothetical protein